jgi:DNA-binding transcriptional LysR family regulator
VLVELTRRHPAIVPEVIASYRLLNLSRRDADIAFRIVPFTEPDIVQRRLMSMPMRCMEQRKPRRRCSTIRPPWGLF